MVPPVQFVPRGLYPSNWQFNLVLGHDRMITRCSISPRFVYHRMCITRKVVTAMALIRTVPAAGPPKLDAHAHFTLLQEILARELHATSKKNLGHARVVKAPPGR